jgi:hypothetical protein
LLGDNKRSLSWQERLQIAHDISHGIEYLHEGVSYNNTIKCAFTINN